MKTIQGLLHTVVAWCAMARRTFGFIVMGIFCAVLLPSCSATLPERPLTRNMCDTSGGESGYPSCLPPSSVLFCPRTSPKKNGSEITGQDKAFVGQLFPSKQFLGPAQPQCPPNSEQLFTKEEKRIVKDGAFAIGQQFGTATFHCNGALESLWNPTDHHTAAYQGKPHQRAIENVLNTCQHDLDVIPPIPAYESAELAGIAEKAFEEGLGAGVSEAFGRVLAIEAAVTAVELLLIEAAPVLLAATELVATRGVRRALDALREMPVFVPLTVDGAGVVMKVARGSSQVLKRNIMKTPGRAPPLPGEFTHHIAAKGDTRAIRSVEILERFGIKVDDEVNGVFLPGYKTSPNPLGKVAHGNLHTNAYHLVVEKRLRSAGARAEAERILRKIADELEHGIIPK